MAKYYAIVNNTERILLFNWDAGGFRGAADLLFATDDLAYIKNVMKTIESIQIVDEYDNEIAYFTEYDTYSSINYLGRNYSSQLESFEDELVVTLMKTSLAEDVRRLNEIVNPIVDFDSMVLEELQEYKINQFSEMGQALIFAGTEVELSDGTKKTFTYNLEDQSNLLNAIFIIQTLGDLSISLPYHGHAEPCELYNAKDILLVYFTLQFFSTNLQTMVNMRNNWVRSCVTKDEILAITFESELPKEWQERADAIMGPTYALAEEVRKKYFEPLQQEENELVESEIMEETKN